MRFSLLFVQSLEKFQRQLEEAEEAAYGQRRGEGGRDGWRRGQNESRERWRRRDGDRDGADRERRRDGDREKTSPPAGRDRHRAGRRDERDEHRGRGQDRSPDRERLRGRNRDRESDREGERDRNRERDSLRSRFLKPSEDGGAEGEYENTSAQFPKDSCSQHTTVFPLFFVQLWNVVVLQHS